MTARTEFSRKVKRQIIERANGFCEACDAVLKPGEGEVDHILPCALGGKSDAANGRLICNVCHKDKTKADVRAKSKADRARDKHSGAMRSKRQMKSRGFDKVPKRGKIDKSALPALPPKRLYEGKAGDHGSS